MSLRGEIGKLMALGDAEQEAAFGVMVRVCGVCCRGVLSPLEGWYEVELGGRVLRVESSLRVRRVLLRGVKPVGGGKVEVLRGGGVVRVFRIVRVRDWDGDVSISMDLSEV